MQTQPEDVTHQKRVREIAQLIMSLSRAEADEDGDSGSYCYLFEIEEFDPSFAELAEAFREAGRAMSYSGETPSVSLFSVEYLLRNVRRRLEAEPYDRAQMVLPLWGDPKDCLKDCLKETLLDGVPREKEAVARGHVALACPAFTRGQLTATGSL